MFGAPPFVSIVVVTAAMSQHISIAMFSSLAKGTFACNCVLSLGPVQAKLK